MSDSYYVGSIADIISSHDAGQKSVETTSLFSKPQLKAKPKKIPVCAFETELSSPKKKGKKKKEKQKLEDDVARDASPLVDSEQTVEDRKDRKAERRKRKAVEVEEEVNTVKKKRKHLDENEQKKQGKKKSSIPENTSEDQENTERGDPKYGNVPTIKDKEVERRTLFLGNVPVSYDNKSIKKLLSTYGAIEAIRFRSAPVSNPAYSKRVSYITKDLNPERQSINCYVRYKSIEEAEAALSFGGTKLDGLTVRADIAAGNKKRDVGKAVFIGNLAFEAEEEELREEFCSCGDIESVRIIRDPVTCAGKGFGYINFSSSDGAQLALEYDGKVIRGRRLRVKSYVKKIKAKPTAATATDKKTNLNWKAGNAKYKPTFNNRSKFNKRFERKRWKAKRKEDKVPSYAGEQTSENKTTKKEKKPFVTKEERKKRKLAKIFSG